MKKLTWEQLFWIFGAVLIFVMLLFLVINWPHIVNFFESLDFQKISESKIISDIKAHLVLDAVILMILIMLAAAIPGAPIAPMCILIGLVFGPWMGTFLNVIANTIGSCLMYIIIEKFGMRKKAHKTGARTQAFINHISSMPNKEVGLTLAYALPGLPSFLINYIAIKMNMSLKKAIPAMIFGYLPISMLYAFGGDSFKKQDWFRLSGSAIGYILIAILIIVLWYKLHKHNKLKKEKENQPKQV